MSELCIQVLGQPHVAIDGQRIPFSRRKSLALLTYLAVSGEGQQRDSLATLLWPETTHSKARGALRRELSSLRRTLGGSWVETAGDEVRLGPSSQIRLDVKLFLQESSSQELDAWLNAAERYRGNFLSGFTLPDSPEFDDWQFFEAEELRHRYAATLRRIIDAYAAQPEETLPYARHLLALDPLDEPAQRQLMRLYAQSGQAAAAVRQYQLAEQILEDEIGVPPSAETIALFEQIRSGKIDAIHARTSEAAVTPPRARKTDWGEAPNVAQFVGRDVEVETLIRWMMLEQCRLIAVLGMGGIGKTTLATFVADREQDSFDSLIWRSLRNAPPLDELLASLVPQLSAQQQFQLAPDPDQQMGQLIDLLAETRALLVLDNVESILEAGHVGHFRDGYGGYGQLLQRIGEGRHRSCLLLTSREKPAVVAALEGDADPVRSLHLTNLNTEAIQVVLGDKGLVGSSNAWQALSEGYSGNPLALKLLTETVRELFDGDIDAFLLEETLIFGGVEALLTEQFDRLSRLEKEVMIWLAIEREPVDARRLRERFVHTPTRRHLLEALRSLHRRSLLERGDAGFSQQNVVMEYATQDLIDAVCREIMGSVVEDDAYLNRYCLMLAQANEYVRQSQERLLLQPTAERIEEELGRIQLRDHLVEQLAILRVSAPGRRGYAGGNLLSLYLGLGHDPAGLDLSGMAVWQAFLQTATFQDVRLSRADLAGTCFADSIGDVMSVALSPNGSMLAAGGGVGFVRIWRRSDTQPVAICRGHTRGVNCVRFSPDGRLLASAADDGKVLLWDVHSGEALALCEGHTAPVWAVAFHPNEQILASAGVDGTVRLWHLADFGRLGDRRTRLSVHAMHILSGHDAHVLVLDFSPDGRTLASGGGDGRAFLWRVAGTIGADNIQPAHLLSAHATAIWALSFSPDGRFLATGGEDNIAALWETATIGEGGERPVLTFHGHTGWVRSICFSPNGKRLATASEDRTLRIWMLDVPPAHGSCIPIRQDQPMNVLTGHSDKVTSAAYGLDGRMLMSGSNDQTIRLWRVEASDGTGAAERVRPVRHIRGHLNRVGAVAFSPDGRQLASGHDDGSVHLWTSDAGVWSERPCQSWHDCDSVVTALRFHPEGNLLAGGSWDQSVYLWDICSGRLRKTLNGHAGDVWTICFSSDGEWLASAGNDRTIRVWDVATGKCIRTLVGHTGVIVYIAFNPVTNALVSADWDPNILLWDVDSGRVLKSIPSVQGAPPFVAFANDGGSLITCGVEGSVELRELGGGCGYRILARHEGQLEAGCVSDDGSLLATGVEQVVHIWDVDSGRHGAKLTGHSALVNDISFSSDNRLLASSGGDETIRVWDVQAALAGSADPCVIVLRVDRPYERTDISGVTGITDAQRTALLALGSVSDEP